ncbi:hypothetical protein ACFFRR_011582 [Megaselia abdita]
MENRGPKDINHTSPSEEKNMESLNSPTTTSTPLPSTISVPDNNTTISTITTNIETPMAPTTTKEEEQQKQHKHLPDKLISSLVKKPQKPDAPISNYIFDSISAVNRHQHYYDQRYGPHFDDIQKEGNIQFRTVQVGGSIYLNCRISFLQGKTVSWVKRHENIDIDNGLELLTVGQHTYTSEKRFAMDFQYPNNWRLKISNATKSDEGLYECQVSTHPPKVIQVNLHVNAPKVMIVDEYGAPLHEKHYEIDSTLQLHCIVRNVMLRSPVIFWKHGDEILNYDITRGGISVKTELTENGNSTGANSTLFIAKISKSDSGNYSCSINSTHIYTINVHILNGESFAELHHGNYSSSIIGGSSNKINLLLLVYLFHLCTIYWFR